MKKILSLGLAVVIVSTIFGQDKKEKKDWSKVTIDRAGDHLMLQFSYDNWAGAPDSIKSREHGFSRGFNGAIMLNKPFKSDPRWSVALGLGVSNSNIFFERTAVDVKAPGLVLPFRNLDSLEHFKKYKLSTTYAEVPIELRFTADPVNQKKSLKAALGIKVGMLLNAHNKGKTLESKNGVELNSYTQKESKKDFFNNSRLAATARFGIGNFSVFGAYSITSLLREAAGANMHPYQIGLCISGL